MIVTLAQQKLEADGAEFKGRRDWTFFELHLRDIERCAVGAISCRCVRHTMAPRPRCHARANCSGAQSRFCRDCAAHLLDARCQGIHIEA